MTTKAKKKDETMELAEIEPRAVEAPVIDLAAVAANPDVDVDKLERLIAMRDRDEEREAKRAYTRAFVKLQGKLPEIKARGKNPTLKSSYAKFEDIQRQIRPALEDNGFVLNFFTKTDDGAVEVTARLSHEGGHYEETCYTITNPGDLKNKGVNSVQAQGSATSYAKRYAVGALLNIITVDEDDDGVGAEAPPAPDGYEEWAADMWVIAEDGAKPFGDAFKAARQEFREHGLKWERDRWDKMKATARGKK